MYKVMSISLCKLFNDYKLNLEMLLRYSDAVSSAEVIELLVILKGDHFRSNLKDWLRKKLRVISTRYSGISFFFGGGTKENHWTFQDRSSRATPSYKSEVLPLGRISSAYCVFLVMIGGINSKGKRMLHTICKSKMEKLVLVLSASHVQIRVMMNVMSWTDLQSLLIVYLFRYNDARW